MLKYIPHPKKRNINIINIGYCCSKNLIEIRKKTKSVWFATLGSIGATYRPCYAISNNSLKALF